MKVALAKERKGRRKEGKKKKKEKCKEIKEEEEVEKNKRVKYAESSRKHPPSLGIFLWFFCFFLDPTC